MRLLWAGFLWSLGIYTLLMLVIRPTPRPVPVALLAALSAAALGCAVAVVLLRRAAAAASQGPRPDLARRRGLDVASYALAEAVALLGLVLGLLGGGLVRFLPFVVASLMGFLLLFPRASDYPEGRPSS
jgi:hypothetical protein